MTTAFTPERSDAIRAGLIENVVATRPRRRVLVGVSLVVAGALAGAGLSTAAFAASGTIRPASIVQPSGAPVPNAGDAVVAPPGTTPGTPIVSLLGSPVIERVAGAAEWSLADRPAAATHVRVAITALTPGLLTIGTDADGNNPSATYTRSDVVAGVATTWWELPLGADTGTLYVDADRGFTASASLQYVAEIPTHLGVNARGETYGVEGGPDGRPDLVLVVAAGSGGRVDGYARAAELDAFSPEHPDHPSNPDEALAWQEERDARYPDGWDIPVYESDGVTQIGTFHIGD